MTYYARTHARTLKFFQRKICTSVTDRCKLLPDNEIDRCRYGDNSDRYLSIWPPKPCFFEENLQEKVKNAQKKLETGLKIDKIGPKSGKIDSKTHKDDDDLKEYIPHFAKKV